MTTVPETPEESARLEALQELELLNLTEYERFGRITRLAKHLFQVPIACIALIDSNQEWFIACEGLDRTGGPREYSFCAHTIMDEQTLVVPDAANDERFASFPQVGSESGIRFYAGHPICAPDGSRIGAVSVRGHEPREFDKAEARLRETHGVGWEEMFPPEEYRRLTHSTMPRPPYSNATPMLR